MKEAHRPRAVHELPDDAQIQAGPAAPHSHAALEHAKIAGHAKSGPAKGKSEAVGMGTDHEGYLADFVLIGDIIYFNQIKCKKFLKRGAKPCAANGRSLTTRLFLDRNPAGE